MIGKGSPQNVVYVGRTWGAGGLRDRLRAFHRSATSGLKGHAGGLTYHGRFGSDMSDVSVRVHLPIAINQADQFLRPYIDFAEKRVLWEHVQRWGRLPPCNSDASPRLVPGADVNEVRTSFQFEAE